MLPKNKRYNRIQLKRFLSRNDKESIYNNIGTFTFVKECGPICVISRKIHQKSTPLRNKARRRIYTLFQKLPIPFSGILYLSKQSYTLPFDEIKKHFYDLMGKAQKTS